MYRLLLGLLATALTLACTGRSAPDTVAVASNFIEPARALVADFRQREAIDIRLVSGSTGKLFSQIENGAPFAAFLAADQERPQRLIANGTAAAGSLFTYARGRIALWDPNGGELGPATLRQARFRHLAIAQPELAPYGRAAMDTLRALELAGPLADRLVFGESVGQTFAFVATGNAELGFVAVAQLEALPAAERGSSWQPPRSLYAPVLQDAVLIDAESAAARAFLAYLRSDAAAAILARYGYDAS